MKKLSIAALLIIALSTGAVSHEGLISPFTDLNGNDCDVTFTPFFSYDVYILYSRGDAGPNGITAAQFKLQLPPSGLTIQEFVPSPAVSATTGNIGVGILLEFASCTGGGMDYLLLGTVTVVAFVNEFMILRIVTAEDVVPENPPVAVRVALCNEVRTKQAVLGGWFTSPNGTCWWPWPGATESKSWGAIKSMY